MSKSFFRTINMTQQMKNGDIRRNTVSQVQNRKFSKINIIHHMTVATKQFKRKPGLKKYLNYKLERL